jgi:hypothetical protein
MYFAPTPMLDALLGETCLEQRKEAVRKCGTEKNEKVKVTNKHKKA